MNNFNTNIYNDELNAKSNSFVNISAYPHSHLDSEPLSFEIQKREFALKLALKLLLVDYLLNKKKQTSF